MCSLVSCQDQDDGYPICREGGGARLAPLAYFYISIIDDLVVMATLRPLLLVQTAYCALFLRH